MHIVVVVWSLGFDNLDVLFLSLWNSLFAFFPDRFTRLFSFVIRSEIPNLRLNKKTLVLIALSQGM